MITDDVLIVAIVALAVLFLIGVALLVLHGAVLSTVARICGSAGSATRATPCSWRRAKAKPTTTPSRHCERSRASARWP